MTMKTNNETKKSKNKPGQIRCNNDLWNHLRALSATNKNTSNSKSSLFKYMKNNKKRGNIN